MVMTLGEVALNWLDLEIGLDSDQLYMPKNLPGHCSSTSVSPNLATDSAQPPPTQEDPRGVIVNCL